MGAGESAACPAREPYMSSADAGGAERVEAAMAAARAEALRWGDLDFLPMHEDQLGGCSRKYLL